ncbi:MAG: hypothetical protein OHK0032_16990 [Thermodesulfovibrionales bacterium]
MKDEAKSEKGIFDLQDLSSIKKRPDILSRIKLEVTPQMVMEPRFRSRPEDMERLKEIVGYMFYIETAGGCPMLMLMKIDRSDVTTTIGRIDEIPADLIKRAIDNPLQKPVYGMYAITDEIKDWLRKELNL